MDLQTQSRMRRIAMNLFLNNKEKDQFLKLYENSNSENREHVLREIERDSESRNYDVRRKLRMLIRDS